MIDWSEKIASGVHARKSKAYKCFLEHTVGESILGYPLLATRMALGQEGTACHTSIKNKRVDEAWATSSTRCGRSAVAELQHDL